jgi:hypothetical protein
MIEATIYYRILTSRAALTGTDGLDAVNTFPLNQGALILVGGTLYRLDRQSVAPPNGVTVIAPIAGPGRWHVVIAAGLGDELAVPNITALKALPTTSPVRVWVESVRCYWRREVASTAAPDDITVAAAIGGGNWERLTYTTERDYLFQADWYVNPTAGDDENPGTLVAPLETLEELTRRVSVGPLEQDTTVHISAGAILSAKLDVDGGGHTVTLRGTVLTVVDTTIVDWTALDHTVPEGSLLQAVGIANWAPLVGMRVHFIDGDAAGVTTWVERANPHAAGAQVARVGPPAVADAGQLADLKAPSEDDRILIEQLGTSIEMLEFTCRDQTSRLIVRDLVLDLTYLTVARYDAWAADAGTLVQGCMVAGGYHVPSGILPLASYSERTVLRLEGCCFHGSQTWIHGATWAIGCTVLTGGLSVIGPDVVRLDYLLSALDLEIGGAWTDQYRVSVAPVNVELLDVQLFDGDVIVDGPANVYANNLSGDGGALQAVQINGNDVLFTWASTGVMNLLTVGGAMKTPTCTFLTWAEVLYDSDEQQGTATLVAGTVTVAARDALDRGVVVSRDTPGGVVGNLSAPVATRTATQFVVNSDNVADTSAIDWHIPKAVGLRVLIAPDQDLSYPR